MAFVDEVTIRARAGKGGDGVVRWLHIKGTEKGGPAGGDGGRGGDVILQGVRDLNALTRFRFEKDFKADDGMPGENDNRTGANGDPLVLTVPIGTTARVVSTGQEFEIMQEEEQVVVLKGGSGGKGNARYKGSTNQNPFTNTFGKPGEGGDIFLNLSLIADAGFIGLPNAGKSSLLNELTNAKTKVGDYPFTTLEPGLGDFYGYILADIPGLIEGASSGRGLGVKFLKHIEKTKILVHLVSSEQDEVSRAYREVRKELESYNKALGEKQEVVILTKTDLISGEVAEKKLKELEEVSRGVVVKLSILDTESVKNVSDTLTKMLRADSQ